MTFDRKVAELSSQAYKDAMGIIRGLTYFPAVHETQRDNKLAPGRTCAVTCISMLLQTHKVQGAHREMESELILKIHNEFPDSWESKKINFLFWASYLKKLYGVNLKVNESHSLSDIYDRIQKDEKPFVISTGGKLMPGSGHIVLARGCYETKDEKFLICNDPWGEFPYKDSKASGEGVNYPLSLLPKTCVSMELIL